MNRTVVFPAAGEVTVEERDRPEPDAGEVLIETEATLVSTGTELTVLSGEYPQGSFWDEYADYPFVPGYAAVGRVRATGTDADVETGTRVFAWTPHADWATAPADDVVAVPEGVDDGAAALTAIAQIVMNGLRRGRVDWGETVAVYGLGIVGQLTVRLARIAGAGTVLGVDLAPERLDYLPDDPAVVGVDPTEHDPAAVLDDHAGRPADVAVEATGNPDAIPEQFAVLREQGRLVLLSSPHGETTLDFHDLVNAPSHEIVGAHQTAHPSTATPNDPWTKARHAELYYRYLGTDRLGVTDLFSHARTASAAPELYADLLADRTDAMGVRLHW